nr:MAG TPA: hypothetical protein [Caudoviricetes sp.]
MLIIQHRTKKYGFKSKIKGPAKYSPPAELRI